MIDVNNVKSVIGIYRSQLYRNFYAVDFIIERGGYVFKIRYPYTTENRANNAMVAIKNKQQQSLIQPDYRPYVWIINETKLRKR